MPRRLALALVSARLACNDLRRDLRVSTCIVLSVTAVVGPLLVLLGLRFGLVETLRDSLRRDPTTLELRPLVQGRFGQEFFSALARQPGVAYLEPMPRFLATILPLLRDGSGDDADGEAVLADMLPSRAGDPLRAGMALADLPADGAVLSAAAAQQLGVGAGDHVIGRFVRVAGDRRQVLARRLRVLGVLANALLPREAILLAPALVLASEDYREGFAAPALGADGPARPPGERLFAGFRLFATDIDRVEPLRAWLVAAGLRVQTAASEIALVQRLDTALGLLFAALALLGGSGAALALAISLWANVERKRHELAVLRLVGFSSLAMAVFPAVQALLIGVAGAAAAVAVGLAMKPVIERAMRGTIAAGIVAYQLPVWSLAAAAGLTVLIAGCAAIAASAMAIRVDPATTLRRM